MLATVPENSERQKFLSINHKETRMFKIEMDNYPAQMKNSGKRFRVTGVQTDV